MGAQVLVQDLDRGLQLDEQLSYAGYSYVNRLEGLWWRPNPQAQMSIVMKNVSDEPIEVRGLVKGPDRGGRPEGGLSRFRLNPHEQRMVSFDGDGGERLRAGDTAGGVTLEFDGPYGALLARLLVEDARSGYSASLALSPVSGAKISTYHGGGLRRSSGDVPLLPVLLARNLGDTSSVVTGRLVFNRADGTVDRIELPQQTLEAGETALMDARTAWGIVQEQAGDEGIGVEFEYTSAPGSVLMSAGLVSGDRNLVFRVPLIDPETPKSSTGGYPWFADDARTTTVFLKNTTTTTVIYLLQVSYEGGVYAPGIKEIEPGQTLALDVRQLRDAQVPDAFGHTIPSNAQRGQVSWTVKVTTPHAMIGRAEHTDHEHGVSASYACLNCCPPGTHEVWILDDPSVVGIGGTVSLYVMAQDIDCYENISADYSMPWAYLDDWYFGNTGIATSYSDSTVYGVSDGQTTFYVTFPGVEYHVEGSDHGWYCALNQVPINISGPVATEYCPGESEKSTMIKEYKAETPGANWPVVSWVPACTDLTDSETNSTNFSWNELNHAQGNPHRPMSGVKAALFTNLESTRTHFGGPIVITSGYRCPHGNKAVTGAGQSRHMWGDAADMKPTNYTPTEAEHDALRSAAESAGATFLSEWADYPDDRHVYVDWRP